MKDLAIGIDIGGTRTKIGLVDTGQGRVIDLLIYPTETKDARVFINAIGKAVNTFKIRAFKEKSIIKGVGFGIPGFVLEDGVVDSTYGFLEFMEDYPLKYLFEKKHKIKCLADNDARVVALGEALYGAGKGYRRVLVLTLGTGLGVGFAIEGKLNESQPFAHMAGHMRITESGVKCYCGKTGCLEALVSATGLCNAAAKINWGADKALLLSAENIFHARSSDSDAAGLVNALIGHLRTGVDNYLNIYAPDVVVLGGGLAKGLVNDLHKLHEPSHLHAYKNYKTKIVVSQLQAEAGILGSAALFN